MQRNPGVAFESALTTSQMDPGVEKVGLNLFSFMLSSTLMCGCPFISLTYPCSYKNQAGPYC